MTSVIGFRFGWFVLTCWDCAIAASNCSNCCSRRRFCSFCHRFCSSNNVIIFSVSLSLSFFIASIVAVHCFSLLAIAVLISFPSFVNRCISRFNDSIFIFISAFRCRCSYSLYFVIFSVVVLDSFFRRLWCQGDRLRVLSIGCSKEGAGEVIGGGSGSIRST